LTKEPKNSGLLTLWILALPNHQPNQLFVLIAEVMRIYCLIHPKTGCGRSVKLSRIDVAIVSIVGIWCSHHKANKNFRQQTSF